MNKWDELKNFVDDKLNECYRRSIIIDYSSMGLRIVQIEMKRIDTEIAIKSLIEAGY